MEGWTIWVIVLSVLLFIKLFVLIYYCYYQKRLKRAREDRARQMQRQTIALAQTQGIPGATTHIVSPNTRSTMVIVANPGGQQHYYPQNYQVLCNFWSYLITISKLWNIDADKSHLLQGSKLMSHYDYDLLQYVLTWNSWPKLCK